MRSLIEVVIVTWALASFVGNVMSAMYMNDVGIFRSFSRAWWAPYRLIRLIAPALMNRSKEDEQ